MLYYMHMGEIKKIIDDNIKAYRDGDSYKIEGQFLTSKKLLEYMCSKMEAIISNWQATDRSLPETIRIEIWKLKQNNK